MINMTVLATVLLVGLTLLIGMSILIYKHYRFRRKSMDWGDIERYDTPLVLLPPGSSNNSSFRSYKYSQLVSKQDSSSRKLLHPQRQCQSVGNIERHRQGSRSSTKSCPPGVFTVPSQEFRVTKEQQLVQPYYYYRQIVVHPSVSKKTRHSLPEVISSSSTSQNNNYTTYYNNYLQPYSSSHLHPNFANTSYSHSNSNNSNNSNEDNAQDNKIYPPNSHNQRRHHSLLTVDFNPQNYYQYQNSSPVKNQNQSANSNFGNFPVGQQPHYNKLDNNFEFSSNKRNSSIKTKKLLKFSSKRVEEEDGDKGGGTKTTSAIEANYRRFSTAIDNYSASFTHFSHSQDGEREESGNKGNTTTTTSNTSNTAFSNNSSSVTAGNMLTHQSRSLPTGPPIPGARLNRTYSISSQGNNIERGNIASAVRKGHRGSSPAIRTFNPDGFSFDVSSPPDSPPAHYTGSRSPSPLYIRAASLDMHRSGSPCPGGNTPSGENFHITATQHSSHSMDSYPSGKAPMLSPNSLCVRRASRCLSPLFIPPTSPKSPTDGNSSSSQPSSTGPLSPMLGSLQLDLYLKKDVTIFLDGNQRITTLTNNESNLLNNKKKAKGENGITTTFSTGKTNGHGSLGRLHFRLKYDLDKSDLHLHIIEANDLAKGDHGGFNDPYIRVFISPEVDTRKRETKIHRNESNPFFDEHFKFPVSQEDLKEKNLMLQILDFDKYSRNDVVGEVSFAFEDFDITTNLEVWAEIVQNKKPSGEKQEILISLSYLPSAERLTVVLLKARNLQAVHNKDTIDPFVKVYLLGGGRRQKKKKTTARKNSNNPIWNEAFTFSIPSASLSKGSIEISVLDQSNDLIGSHALIGSCMIGPHQTGSELSHWQEMSQNLRQTVTMWHVLT